MHTKNIIGPKIRQARNDAEMSQAKLAARLQVMGIRVDRSAIAKIETGRRPVSDVETAAIAETLGVKIAWLFADSGDWLHQNSEGAKSES